PSKVGPSPLGWPAMAALAILACAVPFETARSQVHANGMTSSILLVFAMIFAGLYYSANTVLTSTLFALKSRAPFTPTIWIHRNSWIALAYVASTSIAGLLYLS